MASYTVNWWMQMLSTGKWLEIETDIVDTWGDWMVPILIKQGTATVGGEERAYGTIMIATYGSAITPPTPVQTWSSQQVGGDYVPPPDYATIYNWGYSRLPQPAVDPYEYNGFKFWGPAHGNDIQGIEGECYEFDTIDDMFTAIDNGEIKPIIPRVYFDVYINGSDQPNIFVNWTAAEDLSPVMLSPRVCIGVQEAQIEVVPHDIREYEGLNDPDITKWFVDIAGSFSYDGSYNTSYITIMNNFLKYLNPTSRVQRWGIDGIPDFERLYLRMVYGEEIGDLYRVVIQKDGTPAAQLIDNSSRNASFETIVRFHTGEPDYVMPDDPDGYPGGNNIDNDGNGRYDPDNPPDRNSFTTPIGFDGNAVLTKTYAVSESVLRNIGQKLWTQSYFNVLKIQNNPIENIVAVKNFPFSMSGASEEIQVGDVPFGINGDKVRSVQTIEIPGSYTYTGKFKGYLDLSPFTTIKLNLPYIGLIQLDPADLLGSKLKVTYYVDLVTGQCMANLFLDEDATSQKAIPYMTLYGQMGVDIPLTSSDRVQTELRAASAAVTAMGSSGGQILSGNVAGGVVSGLSDAMNIAGVDTTTQRTASQSPACTSFASPDVFILIERPCADTSQGVDDRGIVDPDIKNGYAHLHGFPCHKYKRLSDYPDGSFVAIERRTDIKIGMTAEENRMLEELLTTGVYI